MDTSVWLDFYEKRGKNCEAALILITKLIEKDSILVYSDLVIRELRHLGYSQNEINMVLGIAKPNNLRRVHIHKSDLVLAKRLALQRGIPKNDALHAILARNSCAELVTTDCHFERLRDMVQSKSPGDFT